MDLDAAKFLTSSEGRELLEIHKKLSDFELHRLLLKQNRVKNIPFLKDIATLLKLRKKAVGKFSKAQDLYFTAEGLEQATEEELADYIAQEFIKKIPPGSLIIDMGSGIGGNCLSLAKYFKVIAIDNNPVHIHFALENAKIYNVQNNIKFICDDAEDYLKKISIKRKKVQAFFFDPQRIRPGKTKTRSVLNSSPPVDIILPLLLKITSSGCIKISPAFDFEEVGKIPGKPAIEVVSKNNNNKLGLLWFGELKLFCRKATCFLKKKKVLSFLSNRQLRENTSIAEKPGRYIYEPNKAIIKAHLINEAASQYGLKKINSMIAFLTSDNLISQKNRAAFRTFEVIMSAAKSLSRFKKELKKRQINEAEITIRGFFLKPEELRKKLKIKEGKHNTIIVTRIKNDQVRYILARKILL